jgi:hypothetical protein
MNNTTVITRQLIDDEQRIEHAAQLFGVYFPLRLEPAVYALAGKLSPDYNAAYWAFYTLSNNGFYMAPYADHAFQVVCDNGYEGMLSADALGITVCLYAYSHLSFSGIKGFSETCAQQYHWLREYMLDRPDAQAILGAID